MAAYYNNSTNNIPNGNIPAHQILISQSFSAPSTGVGLLLNQLLIGQTSADPIGISGSDFLDTVFGNNQGDILYRNSTGWTVLAPGGVGQALLSGETCR